MARSVRCRVSTLAICLSALIVAASGGSDAAQRKPEPSSTGIRVVASEFGSNFVPLGIGKSVVIDLPGDIKDVLVADPKIANAVVRSVRRAYLIGVAIGQTNIYFFDAEGRQLAGFDIAVTRDLNGMRGALKQMFPDGNVRVEAIADGVMLTGIVASPLDSQHAADLAARLVGDNAKVVNNIVVRDRDQVMIHVTFAEVDREVVKQVGINLSGTGSVGSAVLNFNTNNPFSASGSPLSTLGGGGISPLNASPGFVGSYKSVSAQLQAMERAGVTRILAEPTLTAISGESANFLAGGQFPYPTPPQTVNGPIGFSFQSFGLSLTFTPIVLSAGRISLKVAMESSELDQANSVTVTGTTVPGLMVRRATTTVEVPSGGSLALAGMIQEETKHQINGIPQLMQIPILGTLFKSRDYVNGQTELMVIATPYIVQPVARNKLSLPDDGFADAPDPQAVLLGRLNRLYGTAGPSGPVDPQHSNRGNYGFILD
jgi:pilus assembly protein CpaC